MKLKIILLFTLFFGFLEQVKSDVYLSTRSFNSTDEKMYSEWIKTIVDSNIFSNPESPYYGIKTDCADAAFALRAIYAFENQLSFEFIDNSGNIISEKSQRFDSSLKSDLDKLKEMISFISLSIGSEMLAYKNSYPIELKSLRPGDLYVTKWKNKSGKVSRHVYIIKDILPTGDLLLLSSTQPRAVRPSLPRKGMPLHFFSEKPFGFRRFISQPAQATERLKEQLEDYSLSQYDLMLKGEKHFFSTFKSLHKSTEDTLEQNFARRFDNICVALTSRKDIVDMALEEKTNLDQKCFSKNIYDEYSTPSRDKNIVSDIERLKVGYRTIKKDERLAELSEKTILALDYLLGENTSAEAFSVLKEFCVIPILINEKKTINVNIKSFYDRYRAGLVSHNPNESLASRWGLAPASNLCPEK